MKVVFLCSEYPPSDAGGIGVVLKGLCEGISASGHEVHVVGSYRSADADVDACNGVTIHRLPRQPGRSGGLIDRWRVWRCCKEIGRNGPIDILEAPDFEAPGALLPRVSRRRIVRLHGSQTYFAKERHLMPPRSIEFLENWQLANADAWISVSGYTARETARIFDLQRPTHVLHNCPSLPLDAKRKTEYETRRRAVYFGTLTEKKGVFALAKAWKLFRATHPEWTLTVIGRDAAPDGRSVRGQIVEVLGDAEGSVCFAGPVEHANLIRELPGYDFVVLPSYSEAFAMAPMEAMGLGLPVIYSNRSSGPELIDHGRDGWLIDPDDTEAFMQALVEMADNQSLRTSLGEAAYDKIKSQYSMQEFISRNVEIYRDVLSRPAPR